MERMIAYCGLVCTECEAYIATQANDRATLERLATRAREQFNVLGVTAETSMCDGCLSDSTRLCGYCFQCGVRACALQRGVANCAHCADYGCDTLEAFFAMVPKARTTLNGIRAQLAA